MNIILIQLFYRKKLKIIDRIMLISMHVIIGKANEYFSVWIKISPGNLPNGNFFTNGKAIPTNKNIAPIIRKSFCIN